MGTPVNPRAVVYGRQSQHNDRSIGEQLDIGRARADSEAWDVRAVYSDGVSASRHSRKTRDDWPRLLGDVERGDVDVVWLWESSRGDRRASTWLQFLDDCRDHGTRIFVETDGRLYDLAVPRDWRTLAEDGVDNTYESEKTRQRVLRAAKASAADGRPWGQAPYGYRRVYDSRTGRLSAQEPDESEAPVVRELYDRLRGGHALYAVAADLEARGVRTRTGRVFAPEHLRTLALRPCYGGLRRHRSRADQSDKGSLDDAVPATWPPLVDAETFWAVRRLLLGRTRSGPRPGRVRHLLSMIARCGVCGGPLCAVFKDAGRRVYQCKPRGHVAVDADDLEDYAETAILGYLARPDVYDTLSAAADDDELTRVRGDLEAARGDLEEAERATPATVHEARMFARVAETQAARVADLEARDRELSMPAALADLIEPGDDVEAMWTAAPLSTRREVARMLLSPAILGELRVVKDPRPGRRRTPVDERVRWHRD